MSDHFSVIGFRAGSAQELAGLLSSLPEEGGASQPCGPGYYYRWRSPVGSELWVHMQREPSPAPEGGEEAATASENLTIVGVTPFFAGEGRAPVRVMRLRQRPTDNAFEGAAFVEIGPGQKPHECDTVALFDLVDFACAPERETPFLATAQITAFPHDLAIFADEAAFDAAQAGQEVKFAARSFFASGLFTPLDERHADGPTYHDPDGPDFRAPSRAFLTGVIERTEIRSNPVTGQTFRWALVQTLGGAVDLVADAGVNGGAASPGMIVQGEFWLCGRLVDEDAQLGLPGLT